MSDFWNELEATGKEWGLVVGNGFYVMMSEPYKDDLGDRLFSVYPEHIMDVDGMSHLVEDSLYSAHDTLEEAREALEALDMKCKIQAGYPPRPVKGALCEAYVIKKDYGLYPAWVFNSLGDTGEESDRSFLVSMRPFRRHGVRADLKGEPLDKFSIDNSDGSLVFEWDGR